MPSYFQTAEFLLPVSAMLALVLASGFFSSSETALFYLSHDEIRAFRVGNTGERVAANLLLNPDRLLTGVLFWNLVANMTYFAISVVVTAHITRDVGRAAAGCFAVGGLVGIILFGEVIPKNLAVVMRRRLASLVSLPLAASIRVLDPLTPFLARVTRLTRRTFWPEIEPEAVLAAEDLERAVEASKHTIDIVRHERQILHNILDLSEITVEEAMRPRGTYTAVTSPVCRDDLRDGGIDNDYVMICGERREEIQSAIPVSTFSILPHDHLERTAEEVVHVPWCATLATTLQLLRDKYCSVAAVVDEYGTTIGIATYEDIMDTVLMAQPSRTRRVLQREPVLEISPGCYQVEGLTTLRYLGKRLGLDFQQAVDGQTTVAGILHDQLEHIPTVGDEGSWEGYRIEVTEEFDRGRVRVLMSKEAPDQ